MSWLQLELVTTQDQAEALSLLLEQFGAVSVSLAAASDEPVFDINDDSHILWQRTRVVALLYPDADLDIMLVCLRDRVGAENIFSHHIDLVNDRDWVSDFQSEYKPLIFSDRVCISPSWCDDPGVDLPTLILDPGLAFGTGTHPTTSLCIQWLAAQDLNGQCVIDYGCGSAILALVAARLGAEHVLAVDIDPQAIQAATENIERNNLTGKIKVGLVEELSLPVSDILVANILMNPLKELVQTFAGLVKPGGQLMLSGLLHVQAEECLAAYADCFNMGQPVFESEWTRLHGTRK